ncbi:MAG: J domain-containing protein [Myxococcales bacterium]|nr:J domain-containing protein [Myxococcales bacterium]
MTHAASYRLLGLPDAAPLEEVRQAYRRIARRLHPDRVGGDAERFKEITAAYNVLTGRQGPDRAAPARPDRRAAAEPADHAQAWAEWRRRAAGVDPRGARAATTPGPTSRRPPSPGLRPSPTPRPSRARRPPATAPPRSRAASSSA